MSTSAPKRCFNKIKRVLSPTSPDDGSGRAAMLKEMARETIGQTYIEEDPSVAEWFRGLVPSSLGATAYVRELFPCVQWVKRYNLQWLVGDIIAGKS